MELVVQKYGGSSVANPERIMNVARRAVVAKRKGNQVIVVVSAMQGETDRLIDLAHQVNPLPSHREMDQMVSTGEQVSVALLAMGIHRLGEKAISMTGFQVGIVTDELHTQAKIVDVLHADRVKKCLKEGNIVIIAGFQGQTRNHEITTLGRGGSDLTAVAMAKVFGAKVCEIYTDVDGVYTADPRIVPNARKLKEISYEVMLEMAALGSKVMHSRSIEVGKIYNVPILVKSSLNHNPGTLITEEKKSMEKEVVSGISLNAQEAKVTIFAVPDRPGVAAKIFKIIADHHINIDMIIQNKTNTKNTDISFTLLKSDLKRSLPVVQKAAKAVHANRVACDENIAKVSIVGVGMRSHSGVASKMFSALANQKINIEMISTSEIRISCVIPGNDGKRSVSALHKAFRLARKK